PGGLRDALPISDQLSEWPAPSGPKSVAKSAWSSLLWTTPTVPKPLNENIESSAWALAANGTASRSARQSGVVRARMWESCGVGIEPAGSAGVCAPDNGCCSAQSSDGNGQNVPVPHTTGPGAARAFRVRPSLFRAPVAVVHKRNGAPKRPVVPQAVVCDQNSCHSPLLSAVAAFAVARAAGFARAAACLWAGSLTTLDGACA